MNFAFVVVIIAAVSGIASEVALRPIAPQVASALALCVMSLALLGAAWRVGRKPTAETARAPMPPLGSKASESLAPT